MSASFFIRLKGLTKIDGARISNGNLRTLTGTLQHGRSIVPVEKAHIAQNGETK